LWNFSLLQNGKYNKAGSHGPQRLAWPKWWRDREVCPFQLRMKLVHFAAARGPVRLKEELPECMPITALRARGPREHLVLLIHHFIANQGSGKKGLGRLLQAVPRH
jgi:hypothetical protein